MGSSEADKPLKLEKPTSPTKEQSNIHVYPDWAAVQAYYGAGAIPPPYFSPAVAPGHAAHPYMWAPPQMMPPYGSPYAAMYPHAGIYGPPATPVVATPLTVETPSKSGNDSGSGKNHKESDVRPTSGNSYSNSNRNVSPKHPGDADFHGQSRSTDCGTEGSCDRSDNSTTREDNITSNNRVNKSGVYHGQTVPHPSMDANAGNGTVQGIPLASAKPVGTTPVFAPCTPRPSCIGIQQDGRELKREKRKQSNRESARRSRLRKQAEMEELGRKVNSLTVENMALRSEINKLVEDSEKLRSENAALMEKLNDKQSEAGEMACDKIEEDEKSHSTENMLSKVKSPVANGGNERVSKEKPNEKAT